MLHTAINTSIPTNLPIYWLRFTFACACISLNILSYSFIYVNILFHRNLWLFGGLWWMDTSFPHNSSLIDIIQREALGLGLLEAFLESAPQFVLQCSIILRTGIIGTLTNYNSLDNCFPNFLTS